MLAVGFPPLVAPGAHSLILGSIPGQTSLRRQRYYAHPRNAFWPIVRHVLGLPEIADHAACHAALIGQGFALWDVLAHCERPGSLDADIRAASILPNDFPRFLSEHPDIQWVFFNGTAAQQLWARHVQPTLPPDMAGLRQHRLPSTSPAHAGMTFDEKARQWHDALGQARNDARQRAKSGHVPERKVP
ncbi:DNA-deoxyinosine glycosylase [Xanthomonadaceae bacterium JHOS43]|nr:DNA-deoxyinosine glycosylase [Xanthomonadaceae bacterium JHOS43]MCX7562154.1 DNA-deoxyinosine glycosylase [Xanthomonadaceae bacterium XH05]